MYVYSKSVPLGRPPSKEIEGVLQENTRVDRSTRFWSDGVRAESSKMIRVGEILKTWNEGL